MFRVEDKFICSESEWLLLQARMETVLRHDSNQKGTEGYHITSVYFDDLCNTNLQDTVDGNQWRKKYRIRIYNNSFDVIKLEIKYKRYNRVRKISRIISYNEMCNLIQGKQIKDEAPSMENPITLFNIAISQKELKPKVIVAYDRTAYVYDCGNVRITFDRNVRAGNQIEKFMQNKKEIYLPVREIDRILEVKYDEFLPDFIKELIETKNMNQISYSKYKKCMESIGEVK